MVRNAQGASFIALQVRGLLPVVTAIAAAHACTFREMLTRGKAPAHVTLARRELIAELRTRKLSYRTIGRLIDMSEVGVRREHRLAARLEGEKRMKVVIERHGHLGDADVWLEFRDKEKDCKVVIKAFLSRTNEEGVSAARQFAVDLLQTFQKSGVPLDVEER